MTEFDPIEVIATKRDRGVLSDAQIDWSLAAYLRGEISEEQMAALAMAIVLNGMTRPELARWTAAMIASGERLDFSDLDRPTVDKHSTGGVGDKITLVLAPLVAACGAAVPQIAGRGLGYTGGTLDKLEAIPGWSADLGPGQVRAQLERVGAVICGAGPGLAPADRKLYALRDLTGTVESIPLIASSILSKKVAGGAGALVLDVKAGGGGFSADLSAARDLAETLVWLGNSLGLPTTALLTEMDTPLGRTAGNALEVGEALDVLGGGGPADVVELTLELAAEMLAAAGIEDLDPAAVLASGRAMDTWREMIRAQGGDPTARLPEPLEQETVHAEHGGVLTRLDARAVGIAAWRLGAGRARPGDRVQAAAGVRWHHGVGALVGAGDALFTLCTDEPERLARARQALEGAAEISDVTDRSAAPGLARNSRILGRIG